MSDLAGEFEDMEQRAAVCMRQSRERGKDDSAAAPIEHKTIPLAQASIEVKAEGTGPLVLTGYASTYDLDLVGDAVVPGAYAKTIDQWRGRGWSMPMLFNHHADRPIGKWIELREDGKGLFVTGELTPGNRLADDIAASLKHGAVSGLSIGYRVLDAERAKNGVRQLRELELIEISAVVSPANVAARVIGLKSADEIKSLREFEAFLREHGWSRREAQVIGTKGFSSLARESEAEDGAEQPRADGESERRDDGNEAAESAAPTRQEAMVEQVGPNLDELRLLAERLRQLATAA